MSLCSDGTQSKDDKTGDGGRQTNSVMQLDRLSISHREQARNRENACGQHRPAQSGTEKTANATEKSDQAKRANAGDPFALLTGALVPASLQTDQQPSYQRNRKAVDELRLLHRHASHQKCCPTTDARTHRNVAVDPIFGAVPSILWIVSSLRKLSSVQRWIV